MSSPRRAPKAVDKSADKAGTKAAPRIAAVAPAEPSDAPVDDASAEAERLAGVLERGLVDGKLDVVSAEALRRLFAAACRIYTARTEAGDQFTPVSRNAISATDAMVTASGLLKSADLAVFELGMWQSWTGR